MDFREESGVLLVSKANQWENKIRVSSKVFVTPQLWVGKWRIMTNQS